MLCSASFSSSPISISIGECVRTGSAGRPPVSITRSQLTLLRDAGFTAVQIAQQLACSTSVVYRRLASESLSMHTKYANVTDAQLDAHITEIHKDHTNAGCEVN